MLYQAYILLFSILLCCTSVAAQTCCSAGAPISTSFGINTTQAKSIALQLQYEYNSVNLLIDNNKRLVNDPRRRNGHSLLLKTDFVLNPQWAFSAILPFVVQRRKTISETENATGLGDLSLLAQYTPTLFKEISLSWTLGIKLPTGQQYLTDDRGINLSPDMQSGSGTMDFIGQIALLFPHSFIRNLNNQTAVSYRYNTTNAHFGDPSRIAGRRFKFGNELQVSTTFSYSISVNTFLLRPEIGIRLRHSSPNLEQNNPAPNSGGYWINLPLGLRFQTGEQFSIAALGEIPLTQYLDGLQITTDFKLGLQLRYQFSL